MNGKLGIGIALAALAATLGGCATTPRSGPVEVLRYHLDNPNERGTLIAEPFTGGPDASLEFKTYAAAIETEAYKNGFTAPAPGARSDYFASVGFTRSTEQGPPGDSGVRVGVGGGGFSGGGYRGGGGVGLGGGISFPIGKSHPHLVIVSTLAVQIHRRSDGTVIWEGRARTAADETSPDAITGNSAAKMAHALFLGFPGDTGRTITVK
jgi:hypothetical protein